MNDIVQKYRENLDWSIIASTLTATVIAGVAVYGLRKVGLNQAARVVTAAK